MGATMDEIAVNAHGIKLRRNDKKTKPFRQPESAKIFSQSFLTAEERRENKSPPFFVCGALCPLRREDSSPHPIVSAVYAVDYLLTWDCKDLANAQIVQNSNSG